MCEVMEKENIQIMILTAKSLNATNETTVQMLVSKFGLSEEEAKEAIADYEASLQLA